MLNKRSSIGASVDLKEVLSGLLMIAAAAGYAWLVLRPDGLSLGVARAMGPGYFPLMVSIVLAALGLIMVVTAFGRATAADIQLVPLRSILLVLLSPVVFALAVRPLGFVFAVAAMVMIAAWSSFRMSLKWAINTTAFMTVFSVVLFYYLLKMPVTLWGDGSVLPFR